MPSTKQTHTLFEYMYRDASNYKARGTLLLHGTYSDDQQAAIEQCCESTEYFVAEQLDIPALCKQLWSDCCGQNRDDHAWHEFVGLSEPTIEDQETLKEWGTVDELLRRFRAVEWWNLSLSPNA